ncbi:MAG: enoyl-CoA hydratase-related protein, partial [Gammaproteobacteria bacterium]
EAKSIGLVNQVYTTQEEMLEGVMGVAREIASKAPLAIYGLKQIMNHSRDNKTADTLDYIALWNASMLKTDEIQEAMQASGEKRPGEFVDLPKLSRS